MEEKKKTFWQRPEGKTCAVVLGAAILGGGYLLYTALPTLIALTSNVLALAVMLMVLGAIIYMALDPKMRTLVGYMYKSVMRWVTGIFVQIDPIGILKSYIDDLKDNLRKMNRQIGQLRGQMQKLKELIINNFECYFSQPCNKGFYGKMLILILKKIKINLYLSKIII